MWIISQALMKDYENSHFSQVRAAASLPENCSDGVPSVPSNTNPTPQAYLSPDRTTEACHRFPSSMTLETLTEDRGEDLLTWYRGAFLAKTSLAPEKARASKATGRDSGTKCSVSFARYDPATFTLKTAQCSLLEDLTPSSVDLPKAGSMLNGQLFQQVPLAHGINANGYGFSPDGATFFHTPNTAGLDGGSNSRRALKKRQLWQTPTVTQIKPRSEEAWADKGKKREATNRYTLPPGTLQEQVLMSGDEPCWDWHKSPVKGMWPTPQANKTTESGDLVNADGSDWNGLSKPHSKTTGRPVTSALADAVKMWPTPTSSTGGSNNNSKAVTERGHGTNLVGAVAKFPTPIHRDYKDGSFSPETKAERDAHTRGKPLSEFVGGRLNPDWTELLMLWPKFWTSLHDSPDMTNWGSTADDWEDGTPRVTANCPNRAARLKAIGNGQVPACAAAAWRLLNDRFR